MFAFEAKTSETYSLDRTVHLSGMSGVKKMT